MGLRQEDWVLLAVAAGGGEAVSPVVLQKSLFLLGQWYREELGPGFFQFEPYHYGPFCGDIYMAAAKSAKEGYIAIYRRDSDRWNHYCATPAGLQKALRLRSESNLPEKVFEYLNAVVAWARNLSFPQLVSAIYAKYPEYRENSVFQGA